MTDPGPSRRTTRATAKRSIGTADISKELNASKRPALSSAFSNHISQSTLNRQLLTAQCKVTELQNALSEKETAVERLEADRRYLATREKEERESREQEATEYAEERERHNKEMSDLRRRLIDLENEHADLQDSYSEFSHSTQSEIETLKAELHLQTQETTRITEDLQAEKQAAAAALEKNARLEAQLEAAQATERAGGGGDGAGAEASAAGGDSAESWRVIREELHRQAGYLRTLEATNARLNNEVVRLRQRAEVAEVLREEKLALEKKARGADELRQRVGELEGQLAAERTKYAAESAKAAGSETPGKTPVAITRELQTLRTSHAILLDEHGQLKASLRQREAELVDVRQELERAAVDTEQLTAEIKQVKEASERKQRDFAAMEREISFLKALLTSYTAEETSNQTLGDDETKPQLRLEQRIAHLEELLEEYKTMNKALRTEVDKLAGESGPSAGKLKERWKSLATQVEDLRLEKAELEQALRNTEAAAGKEADKVEELEQTLFELRGEIGQGSHVPPGMRVLCLKQNPAQTWADSRKEVLDRLKAENEALLKRLRELQEGGARIVEDGIAQADAVVPKESWEAVSREKAELEEAVKQKEKRLLRLQEIFHAKSAEFRETIASILGLKLAFYPNGQVRVTSVFDLNACFVFQPSSRTEGAKMQLIGQGDGGPQDLPQLKRYWVDEEECIPGFLASITLECFDKAKAQGSLSRGP